MAPELPAPQFDVSGPDRPNYLRDRFDLRAFAVGVVVSGFLGLGLAIALMASARSSIEPDVGPTAATLEEAMSGLLGVGIGLFVGAGLAAGLARRGPRIDTGLRAAAVSYLAVIVPALILTGPSDAGVFETLIGVGAIAVPLAVPAILGALFGAFVRLVRIRVGTWRRSPP